VLQQGVSLMKKQTVICGAIGLLTAVLSLVYLYKGIVTALASVQAGTRLAMFFRGIIPIERLSFLADVLIALLINVVLYGLLTGVICQWFIPKTTEKTILKNTGIVFLVTLLLGIVTHIIARIGEGLNFYMPVIGRFHTEGFFGAIGRNIGRWFLFGLKQGLFVGIICSVSVFVFLKISQKKGRLPIVEINKILAE
jgi:hypothetical protein